MGPLAGVKVLEIGGIGPGPFCGMLLADYGATVTRIDSPTPRDAGIRRDPKFNLLLRGRRSLTADLKTTEGVALVRRLATEADILFEGFRPGVMERLGLGPDDIAAVNPALVYGRVTGWGQDGPLAQTAGHDLNYIALTGALHAMGEAGRRPTPPLNVVGDYGGGGMLLALGLMAALIESRRSGRGQVVDASVLGGTNLLMTMFQGLHAGGSWNAERGTNFLDGAAPYYRVYDTADDRMIAVGCIEPKFYAQMIARLGLDHASLPDQMDRARWPELTERLAARFAQMTRDETEALFEGTDCCVTPVLDMTEAAAHPAVPMVTVAGIAQAAPAPVFSRTPAQVAFGPSNPGADNSKI